MSNTLPMTPAEVQGRKAHEIPSFVVDAFNEMLTKTLSNGRYPTAHVKQDDVLALIVRNMRKDGRYALPTTSFADQQLIAIVLDNKWLDIEHLYSSFGWKVTYAKSDSAHTGSYSYFTFTATV